MSMCESELVRKVFSVVHCLCDIEMQANLVCRGLLVFSQEVSSVRRLLVYLTGIYRCISLLWKLDAIVALCQVRFWNLKCRTKLPENLLAAVRDKHSGNGISPQCGG